MYHFECVDCGARSHSASLTQIDPSCPTCGGDTARLIEDEPVMESDVTDNPYGEEYPYNALEATERGDYRQ